MDVDLTGSLKRIFGKTLPVKLSTDMSYDVVLKRSLEKWKDYDRTFSKQEQDYVLAYQDTNFAHTIPETVEEFTLKKYKKGLGKSYSRIMLFFAPVPEIGDIDVPNANPSDTELETFENTDELFNDDIEFLSSNGYISAAESSVLSNCDIVGDAVISYEVADFFVSLL